MPGSRSRTLHGDASAASRHGLRPCGRRRRRLRPGAGTNADGARPPSRSSANARRRRSPRSPPSRRGQRPAAGRRREGGRRGGVSRRGGSSCPFWSSPGSGRCWSQGLEGTGGQPRRTFGPTAIMSRISPRRGGRRRRTPPVSSVRRPMSRSRPTRRPHRPAPTAGRRGTTSGSSTVTRDDAWSPCGAQPLALDRAAPARHVDASAGDRGSSVVRPRRYRRECAPRMHREVVRESAEVTQVQAHPEPRRAVVDRRAYDVRGEVRRRARQEVVRGRHRPARRAEGQRRRGRVLGHDLLGVRGGGQRGGRRRGRGRARGARGETIMRATLGQAVPDV